MRAVFALLFLASCATVQAPPERLSGCWINRADAGGASAMRWLPDVEGGLRGELSASTGGSEAYVLRQRADGWALCQIADGGQEPCWKVAQGAGGSLEGGRAFIDGDGERLRIAIVSESEERLIFQGARDGCD